MKPLIALMALACVACAGPKDDFPGLPKTLAIEPHAADAGRPFAMDFQPTRAVPTRTQIAELERKVRLPSWAPIQRYDRHYVMGRLDGRFFIAGQYFRRAPGQPDGAAHVGRGEGLVTFSDVRDCEIIQVLWDLHSRHTPSARCVGD